MQSRGQQSTFYHVYLRLPMRETGNEQSPIIRGLRKEVRKNDAVSKWCTTTQVVIDKTAQQVLVEQ